jgi:ubiquinone/menaquinone biosynthesis C-methylase UbiE
MNKIVATYSRLADEYRRDETSRSCWFLAANKALAAIELRGRYRTIADIGCGTGRALSELASRAGDDRQFVGVEPADNMRALASELTRGHAQIRILAGVFEKIPLESQSVDYLYSILAFHWTTDLTRSAQELARVLKHDGEMDLFFIGRNNGQEFIRKTTPIFLKYMGPVALLRSAGMRQQLTKDEALRLFGTAFPSHTVTVEESYDTYYDTLEGHWTWWVRIEGQLVEIPAQKRSECDEAVKAAMATLQTPEGIPYTIHMLHVKVRSVPGS